MVPGDLGSNGGIRTDVHGRALRDDGSVIVLPLEDALERLYAHSARPSRCTHLRWRDAERPDP
jgi:hypothetical protein